MGTSRHYSDRVVLRRLLQEGKAYLPHATLLLFVSLLAMPVALLAPLPLKIAVDNVVQHHPLPGWLAAILPASMQSSRTALAVSVALMLVLITLVGETRTLAEDVLSSYTGEKLLLIFRTKLLRQSQRLSLSYHDRMGTADSVYRIQWDSWSIRTLIVSGVTALLTAAVTLGAMLFVIAQIDWQLGLIALAVSPFLFTLTWLSRSRLRQGWRDAKEIDSSSLSVVQEVLTSLRVVKAFGREDREEDRFARRAQRSANMQVRLSFIESLFGLGLAVVTSCGTGLVLLVGIQHVRTGALTLGTLLLVMGYMTQLYAPLQTIARQLGSLQAAFASGERVLSLLDQAPDVREHRNAVPIDRAHGAVEFRNVTFGYDPARPVLHGVGFAVEPGMRVGIVGHTGSGKSTLMNLLMRFYDPSEGQITLDGVDLRAYKVDDLRDQFAIVLQEPVLFSTTIRENIAYGRLDASPDELAASAEAANAHDFITALPDGYDTVVGERGMTLSGGERQRISLARAFLRNAPILILDEPTSSVDVNTEAAIIDAMERLMHGRTTFMIAHRLATLRTCDAYLQLANGRLVSTGPPREAVSARSSHLQLTPDPHDDPAEEHELGRAIAAVRRSGLIDYLR